jgi:UDP-N-acetylglucosamine--N-acetylmuramyl-(pentapeptide) pyrophosphoryl-undecaprenol N-acetylglucosamine transferase
MSLRFLIMAGGTGGHVFPALAVAEALIKQGHKVEWLGTSKGLEAKVVPTAGIHLHCLNISGLRGRGLRQMLLAPWFILRAIFAVRRILKHYQPAAVIGLGGYVAGPGGVAAFLSGTPLIIHEQNAVAGTTNRLLARFARRVLSAFPAVLPGAITIGNPLRQALYQQPEPAQRSASRLDDDLHLLILGGSLGAQALNQMVPHALSLLLREVTQLRLPHELRLQVRHQAGVQHVQTCELAYRERQVNASVEPFIEDVASALGWADLVICRAGALTLAELCAVGVGAILVPYPFAIDDHQTANAQWLVGQGGAILAAQNSLSAERLSRLLKELLASPQRLHSMAEAARAAATPSATEAFVQQILALSQK